MHRLGQTQSDDLLVYARPDKKEWGFHPIISDDAAWLILQVWQGTDRRNRVFYAPLAQALAGQTTMTELIPALEAKHQFIGNEGTMFYFLTGRRAGR